MRQYADVSMLLDNRTSFLIHHYRGSYGGTTNLLFCDRQDSETIWTVLGFPRASVRSVMQGRPDPFGNAPCLAAVRI